MQLKKHFCLLLAFLVLVSNSGLAFNVHFCKNEIASISLSTVWSSQKAEVDCCGVVVEKSKCCNDKIIKAEIKSEQIIVKSMSFDVVYLPVINDWMPIDFFYTKHFKEVAIISYYYNANAPPLYLLHSQFTLYA